MQSEWYFSKQHCILGINAVWWAKPQQKQSLSEFFIPVEVFAKEVVYTAAVILFLSSFEVALSFFFFVYSLVLLHSNIHRSH